MRIVSKVLCWLIPGLSVPLLDVRSDLEKGLHDYFIKQGYDSNTAGFIYI